MAMTFRAEGYTIERVSHSVAMELVVRHHYLHRKAPCSIAFGLFSARNPTLPLGVVVYGTPASSPLRKGVAGPKYANQVIELTRLWVDDRVPKNGESFLIGNTVRRAGKDIVVSFAEIQQGHTGVVYQATNWLYTGLSAKRSNWTVDGIDLHSHTLADRYTAEEIRAKYGDRFRLVQRPRKHRYVFINARGRKRKEILQQLRYPIVPYPKSEGSDD